MPAWAAGALAVLAVAAEAAAQGGSFGDDELALLQVHRGVQGAPRRAAPSQAQLWGHLRAFVLPHRKHLGPDVSLKAFWPGNHSAGPAPFSVRGDFSASALPQGMRLVDGDEQVSATRVYYGGACGALATSADLWASMEPGAVVAVPICSEAEFDEAYGLLYTVNCDMLWGNHRCGEHPGKQMSCKDFPRQGLGRLAFVPGFFVLEKQDQDAQLKALGSGPFLSYALDASPPTDKVTKHAYQLMYERYFPSKRGGEADTSLVQTGSQLHQQRRFQAKVQMMQRYLDTKQASDGEFLEIGLGCNMNYGPGKSADLWRRYFPNMHVNFMEYNGKCVEKWQKEMDSMNITVYVGDQEHAETNLRVAGKAGTAGFAVVVDDGAHTNSAMRTSFQYLWPALAHGGFYVIEDLGEPAFSYLDCEPLQATNQKQTTTALAKVIEVSRPLVLGLGQQEAARAECNLEICLVQRA